MSFIDRAGTVVKDVGEPRASIAQPTLSPAGDRVAFVSRTGERDELWTLDLASGIDTQLTRTGTRGDPAWSRDGSQLYFSCGSSGRDGGVCRLEADGTGTVVVPGASQPHVTPDGRFIAHVLLDPSTRTDVWSTALDGAAPPRLIKRSTGFDFHPRVSPDGRWIAYASTESKQSEVYVADYHAASRRWQVSTATAAHPRWHPRGSELFFVDSDGRLRSVVIGDRGPRSQSSVVIDGSTSRLYLVPGSSVGAGGESFLVIRDVDRGSAKPAITIVENWFAEFAPPK